MLENWGLLEADFQAHWRIESPLRLTWRRFKVLLRALPVDSLLLQHWRRAGSPDAEVQERYQRGSWWRRELDQAMGRQNRGSRVISLDDFRGGAS